MPLVGFQQQALDDVERIVDWLLSFNPQAAMKFIDRYEQALDRLRGGASIGHRHPQLTRRNALALKAGDFLIVFEDLGDSVRIMRVVHGRSNLRRLGL